VNVHGAAIGAKAANVVDGLSWRKSTWSSFQSNCTEVAIPESAGRSASILVRDSKDPGPTLKFSRYSWSAFISFVKQADF